MKNAWLGYLSSALLLFAGVFMIAGHKVMVGCLFIVLAIVSLLLKLYMSRK